MADGARTMLECPKDRGTMLVEIDRGGVMVDACPRCRGVWLDRGELDKLIDLEAAGSDDLVAEIRGGSRERGSDESGEKHGSGHGSKRRRRRGGFLGEMFDLG